MNGYFQSVNSRNLIDNYQTRLNCCGYYSYYDWININETHGIHIHNFPESCCLKNYSNCIPWNLTESNGFKFSGCLSPISKLLTDEKTTFILFFIIFLIAIIIFILFLFISKSRLPSNDIKNVKDISKEIQSLN